MIPPIWEIDIIVMSFHAKPSRFHNLILSLREIDVDRAANRFLACLVHLFFFEDSKLYWLISASFLVLFASVWLMLSPGLIFSREMTWDLLYNLEGAWRLYTGQVAHVDFHDPLGTLPYEITVLGFKLVGIKPLAFLVGECISAAVFTVLVIVAVKDRLPALPGFLFVSLCVTLVLVPGGMTIWDYPSAFTFAMGYNRLGWSALSILCLLLFIEPREARDPRWTDLAAGFILMVGLFYLKVTYFGVAVAATSLALLTSRHIRRHWPWWCGTLLLVILVAFLPMNYGYRGDIIFAVASGRIRSNPVALVNAFARTGVEQIWVLGEIIVLLYLWGQRYAPFFDVVFGLYIWISGLFLLSQNAQMVSVPLYTVLALLLYVRLADRLRAAALRPSILVSCAMTCVLLPLLPLLFANSITLIGYNIRARQIARSVVVTTSNLRGLAVPVDSDNILDEVAAGRDERGSFSRTRALCCNSGFELSQREYIKTILALADFLWNERAASAGIVVIDQVNPLPFVLGVPAPRGGNLWSGGGVDWQPPEEALREAHYVAIPRFPTEMGTVIEGLDAYREYLSTRFVQRYETPYWTVLERRKGL
jgi:hypothetical protein